MQRKLIAAADEDVERVIAELKERMQDAPQ